MKKSRCSFVGAVLAYLLLSLGTSFAQLNDITQTPNSENAGILKSLIDQIGSGRGDEFTPDSSLFIIKRDPFRSIRRGRQLFQRKFTVGQGMGPRTNDGVGDISADKSHGAGLSDSCASCHGRPKGAAGFGGDVFTRPDSRDAPHLFGLGIQEMLADEMTSTLRAIRDQAILDAQNGVGGEDIVLIDANFNNGTNGFNFVDDPFNTSNPFYSSGFLDHLQGESDRAVIELGGNDNTSIFGMSGGWSTTFNLQADADVRISFDYRLIQSPDYENDEISQARISVDGTETILTEFTGNGNGGPEMNTGIQLFSLDIHLNAGSHTLILGAFNNKKTQSNEETFVSYDNVKVATFSASPGPVTRQLSAKGVNFGSITAFPDETVDFSDVEGVDEDLRIRPFFAQGGTISIREFVVGAFNAEMGLEAPDPDLLAASSGSLIVTPSGMVLDGSKDIIEAPPVSSTAEDSDGDGVTNEIDTALVDHVEFYLLNYFKPATYKQNGRTDSGRQLFGQFGCTTCHVPSFTIDNDRRVADVDTVYDPTNGIFNRLFATANALFVETDDGSGFPTLKSPSGGSFLVENFYADFKRHDLGPNFWERNFDGSITKEFMTEPLWGVGTTAPYGHDGRSINLEEVILRHGGEASASRQAFAGASDNDKRKLMEFLQSLVLFAPDDTASNLNPGDPSASDFPQRGHGSIKLPALFNDPSDLE